ncbi:MAG: hypothetical protein JXB47_00315 [Anaerolineae bacterium]|nr:hypothetical protein [Anaerolineae bacterium]
MTYHTGAGPRRAFEQALRRTWAAYFGTGAAQTGRSGTDVYPREWFAGSGALEIWRIGERAFIETDPALAGQVRRVVDQAPSAALTAADFVAAWQGGDVGIKTEVCNLYYLYPADFKPFDFEAGAPFAVRRLAGADRAAFDALLRACAEPERAEAFVALDHEVAFGAFDGAQMVAAASMYDFCGFADPGVITHPGCRRRGLGKAVVSRICEWVLARGRLMQYRAVETLPGSNGIAKSLGFTKYFVNEGVYLETEKHGATRS